MLTCRELTELVTDHLEGRLPLAQGMSVSLHLSSCRHCRAYLEQMKSLLKLLRKLPADPARPKDARLLRSFQRRRRVGYVIDNPCPALSRSGRPL
jgi:predicted anti-sigma-YlaC factor YlaD